MKYIQAILLAILSCTATLAIAQTNHADWTQVAAQKLLQDIKREADELRDFQARQAQAEQQLRQSIQLQQNTLKDLQLTQGEIHRKTKVLKKQLQELTHKKDILATAGENLNALTDSLGTGCLEPQGKELVRKLYPAPQACQATLADGTLCSGQQLTFGPFSFFLQEGSHRAGLLIRHPNQPLPTLFTDLTAEQQQAVQQLFNQQLARAPLDPSGGKALATMHYADTPWQHLKKGGPIMLPLILLGMMAACAILFKACQFCRTGRYLDNLKQIFQDHPDLTSDAMEEKLYLAAAQQGNHLEHYLSTIAICASAAPLLGLLGTVTGMIHTFSLITLHGTGDPRLLSTGISEALITTEAGLAIAIPAILAHAWLSRKLKRFRFEQRQTAIRLLTQPRGGDHDSP